MDHFFDLTNYRIHPAEKSYNVYHFTKPDQADYFETLLIEYKLHFERYNEKKGDRLVHYFGIKRIDENISNQLNNLTLGRYRRKFIPDRKLRMGVMVISFGVLLLAIIGFIKSN